MGGSWPRWAFAKAHPVRTTPNQPEINPATSTVDAITTIAEQKRVLLKELRKYGIRNTYVDYNAINGDFIPEIPLTKEGKTLPDVGVLILRPAGVIDAYASLQELMQGFLRRILDMNCPGYADGAGSEGHLSIKCRDRRLHAPSPRAPHHHPQNQHGGVT